jgi:hypothetical protein
MLPMEIAVRARLTQAGVLHERMTWMRQILETLLGLGDAVRRSG